MLKAARLLLLALGVAVAGYLIHRHSADVAAALKHVGWGFAAYMAASFAVYALDTYGWRVVFAAGQPHVGFGRLFSVRMAGEAVNKVTPLASLGGEPLKAYLLIREGASSGDALASVAVAKNVMTLAQIAFIFCGIGLLLPFQPQNRGLLLGLGAFPAVILTMIVVTAVVDLRLRRQRRQPSGDGAGPKTRGQAILSFWAQVADFFWAHPRASALSFALFFLGWAAGALELVAAARALQLDLTLTDAIALEALLVSVNMATFFIPANAGSQEGGFALLTPLVGLTTGHGLVLAVLRRCRDAIWIGFGLTYLAVREGRIVFRPRLEGTEAAA